MMYGQSDNDSYPWQWLVLFGLILGAGYFWMFARPQIPTFQPYKATQAADGSRAYYVINMPAIPVDNKILAEKAKGWLIAMASKGYRPMLLSDIHDQLSRGATLPEKAVVLLFNPGYRQTFRVMAPLLAKYKYPAVWVSDQNAVEDHDRRFLNKHVLKSMRMSGDWDVAYKKGDSLIIERADGSSLVIGKDKPAWRADAGRRAINVGVPAQELNRLHLNWNWTDQQLLDRLQAEEHLRDGGYLMLKRIAGHNWGIILPASSSLDAHFGIGAPIDGRTANLTWLGTSGCSDMELNIEVQGLSGEMWLLMRSDESVGESVDVCFGNGNLMVSEHRDHRLRPLATVQYPSLRQPANFAAKVVLRGSSISVFVNGRLAARSNNLSAPTSKEGLVRMTVYDKIVGGAHLGSAKIGITRLADDMGVTKP